jgi:hypothetical protein
MPCGGAFLWFDDDTLTTRTAPGGAVAAVERRSGVRRCVKSQWDM